MLATERASPSAPQVDEIPVQARGGSGLKAAKIDKARGPIVALVNVADELAFLGADACMVVPGQGRARGGPRRRRLEDRGARAALQRVVAGRQGRGEGLGRRVLDGVPVARREVGVEAARRRAPGRRASSGWRSSYRCGKRAIDLHEFPERDRVFTLGRGHHDGAVDRVVVDDRSSATPCAPYAATASRCSSRGMSSVVGSARARSTSDGSKPASRRSLPRALRARGSCGRR